MNNSPFSTRDRRQVTKDVEGGELFLGAGMAQTKFGNKTVVDVWNKTKGRCWYCGIEFDDSRDCHFTIDHVVPIFEMTDNSIDNLVPCCKACNSSKRIKSLEEFRWWHKKRMGMIFEYNQIMWLAEKGITVPEPDEFLFYFERAGLV